MLQIQDQSLRPLTTAHLAQTMSLLVLSNLDLQEKVMQELADNPALELIEERVCPICHRPLKKGERCLECSRKNQDEGPIVFLSPRDSMRTPRSTQLDDDLIDLEPAAPENLTLSVLEQLAIDLDPSDHQLASYILSSLDENGFLQDHPILIARATHSSLTQVHAVIDLISHVDPPGLATAGPREALIAQLDQFPQKSPLTKIAKSILEETFAELGRRDFEGIAMRLDTSVSQVRKAIAFIHDNLTPYPAKAFWGSGRQPAAPDPNVYHTPDILISCNPIDPDGPLMVEIFSAISGWLRVNPLFRKAISNNRKEASEEWLKHMERAALFVKCLQQRSNTMRQLMRVLVIEQRKFILHGDRFLKPMTRAYLAKQIKVHESTISRAVAHKSVALPNGRIIPLNRFFDRSLSVRDRIKEIIISEPKAYTDDQIVDILHKENIRIARRTVAKYRAIEGILPARLRHKKSAQVAARV